MGVATIHNNSQHFIKVYLALRSVQGLGVRRMTAAS